MSDEIINEIAQSLKKIKGIHGSAIIEKYGEITGFALPGWVDPEGVSAMVALILKASERATKELDQGDLITATLENEKGKLVFTPIGNKVIVIITTKEAQLGLITLKLEAARQRLKGNYHNFTGSFNLFNWDSWLATRIYEVVRRAAFAFFPDALNKPGRIIDAGCGLGISTSAIWTYYYKKGHFHPQTKLELYGIDNGENFIKIATEEFERIASKHKVLTKEEIHKLKQYHPKFKVGTVIEIPYEDNYFDYVYMSQVLHFTNAPKAIKEAYRVLRPGGYFFGTNTMVPHTNPYLGVHLRTTKGATGSFTKKEMTFRTK